MGSCIRFSLLFGLMGMVSSELLSKAGVILSDSLPIQATIMPRKIVSKEYFSLNPKRDTLGVYPYVCGSRKLPISSKGTTSLGYMVTDESQGFHVRIDNPYKRRWLLRPGKNPKIRTKSFGLEFGLYSSPILHTNLYLLGTNQWKFQRGKRMNYTFLVGGGYSRTFLSSPTYRFKDNQFRKVPLAGYNYVGLQAGFTVEYRLKKDAAVYMGYNNLLLLPYNRLAYPRNQIQFGISIPTAWLWYAIRTPK